MHRQQQHMLLLGNPQQTCPHQRTPRQIKRPANLFAHPPHRRRFSLLLRQCAQVYNRQMKSQILLDNLHRPPIHRFEPGPQ
jgi:hypothetical protein